MKYTQVIEVPEGRVQIELHRDPVLPRQYLLVHADTKSALSLFLAELDIKIIEARRAT